MRKKYQTIKVVLEYFKDEDKIIYLDDDVLQSDSAL